jgi:nitrogen regulatory protein P-II 1
VTKIEAMIRPGKVDDVVAAVSRWVSGVTICEVGGYGRQRGHTEVYRGAEYVVDFVPKVKVEIVCPTPLVPRIVDEIERAVRTGRIGDGKIFVTPIDGAVRVRTGEQGEEAL